MGGHGTIGLMATLFYMGRIGLGQHRIETPVGELRGNIEKSGKVVIRNVASYRLAQKINLNIEGYGPVTGDVARGGNWFFLTDNHGLHLSPRNIDCLIDYSWKIRKDLCRKGITGHGSQEIDQFELFAPPQRTDADAKNFVLCPGKVFDRSPCGTGTSAKIACLVASGHFREGQIWKQEGIIGSLFEAWVTVEAGQIFPSIRGSAYVTAQTTLIIDPEDPYGMGIN